MKRSVPDLDKLASDGGCGESGYAGWKQAKVERGLAQCADRAAMIPVEQVWHDLKLER